MRYFNTVKVDTRIFKNLQQFLQKKKPTDDVFNQLTTSALNAHLKKLMPGLTAKVFRTYNASITLERELAKADTKKTDSVEEKVLAFNRANREVAILCNHQRSQPKKHDEHMAKMDDLLKTLQEEKERVEKHIKNLKSGKVKTESPPAKKVKREDDESSKDGKKEKSADKKKGDETTTNKTEKELKELPNDVERCKKLLTKLEQRISAYTVKKTEKEELKTVALTTSKTNYIDPRITAAWAKRLEVPLEKLFSKSLRDKFPWAMEVAPDWKF
jgi:DNA topoisomerase-1